MAGSIVDRSGGIRRSVPTLGKSRSDRVSGLNTPDTHKPLTRPNQAILSSNMLKGGEASGIANCSVVGL